MLQWKENTYKHKKSQRMQDIWVWDPISEANWISVTSGFGTISKCIMFGGTLKKNTSHTTQKSNKTYI